MASGVVELEVDVDAAEDGEGVESEEEGTEEEFESEEEEDDAEDEEEDGDEHYVAAGADGEGVDSVEEGTEEDFESEEEEDDEEEDRDEHYVAAGADGEGVDSVEEGTEEEFESEEEEDHEEDVEEDDEEEDRDEHYVPAGIVSVRSGTVDANVQPPIVVLEDDGHVQVEVLGQGAGRASQRVEGEPLGAAEGGEDERRPARGGEGRWQEDAGASIDVDMDMSLLQCPICMERWTNQGVHRVCCIPCGHVYGRSCLQRWVQQCRNSLAKCPQCNRRFKMKDIINIYAPQITVVNYDLEKEVSILREKNEILSMEQKRLLEEVCKLKEDVMGAHDRTKLLTSDIHAGFDQLREIMSSRFDACVGLLQSQLASLRTSSSEIQNGMHLINTRLEQLVHLHRNMSDTQCRIYDRQIVLCQNIDTYARPPPPPFSSGPPSPMDPSSPPLS